MGAGQANSPHPRFWSEWPGTCGSGASGRSPAQRACRRHSAQHAPHASSGPLAAGAGLREFGGDAAHGCPPTVAAAPLPSPAPNPEPALPLTQPLSYCQRELGACAGAWWEGQTPTWEGGCTPLSRQALETLVPSSQGCSEAGPHHQAAPGGSARAFDLGTPPWTPLQGHCPEYGRLSAHRRSQQHPFNDKSIGSSQSVPQSGRFSESRGSPPASAGRHSPGRWEPQLCVSREAAWAAGRTWRA